VGDGEGGGGGAVTVVGTSGEGAAVALGDGGGAADVEEGPGGVLDGAGVGVGVDVVLGAGGRQIGRTEVWASSLSCRMASSSVPPGSPAVTCARSDSRSSATFSGLQPVRSSSTPMLVIELRESRQAT
jgi:hypothetical protein